MSRERGDRSDDDKRLYASFCGKSQHEVRKLIAGPNVFICDECVEPVSYTHLDVYKRQASVMIAARSPSANVGSPSRDSPRATAYASATNALNAS